MVLPTVGQTDAAGVSPPAQPISGTLSGAPKPAAVNDEAIVALRQLLRIEADMRGCASFDELGVLLVNELRKVMGARQAYGLTLRNGKPRITHVSGAQGIDRTSPTIRWLESALGARPPAAGWNVHGAVAIAGAAEEEEAKLFPFPAGYWLPIRGHGAAGNKGAEISGILVAGEQAFEEGPVTIGQRLAATAAHAARVLVAKAPRRMHSRRVRLALWAATAACLAALAWPVPMTALAPMEIVPQNAFVVAAPIDGVIEEIAVAPNSAVKAGDVLIRYVDTAPRNQLQLAEREVSVAEAKLRQLQQMIFVEDRAKRELAQARAELALKIAERDFARDTFEKSQIRAPRDGIALYADRKDWVGKPVVTGQRILEIADVEKVELRANLPVADFLDLRSGARVRGFLDSDPLKPIEARLTSASHQARVVEGIGLTYRIQAQLAEGQTPPRPGLRGTAQLFSAEAPLGYYLFRRPLTWARQKAGL